MSEFTVGMCMAENHLFSYRVIISVKVVVGLQTTALPKSGIKLFALTVSNLQEMLRNVHLFARGVGGWG